MNSKPIASLALLLASVPFASPAPAEDIPDNLVVEFRLFEARSPSPDFKTMGSLAFFIETDGVGVTDRQWLATLARMVPDSYLATLTSETANVRGTLARLELDKRSRRFEAGIELSEFLERGTFNATLSGELTRREESQRSFERTIELRTGATFILSGPGLELSASEYLSHFRDYSDADNRRAVYDQLRDFSVFLILAVTPRLVDDSAELETPIVLSLPSDVTIPLLESPFGVRLFGTVELELDIDDDGMPRDVKIVRSSIPEVNPRLLGEAPKWKFPDAAGKRGRLVLELTAEP